MSIFFLFLFNVLCSFEVMVWFGGVGCVVVLLYVMYGVISC